jgi:hypothetical protein
MLKKNFTLLFCALFLNQFAQSDKQILEFTKANYLKLIGQMPSNKMADFGFANKEEIAQLTFTKVFPEYILTKGTLAKTNNFRVLAVNDKGKPRGLFTVFIKDGEMMIADFGANELSKIVSCSSASFDKDAKLSILKVLNTQSDYLFDETSGASSRKYLKLFENNFYSPSEIKEN